MNMPISTSDFYNNINDERMTVAIEYGSFFQRLMQYLTLDGGDITNTVNQQDEDPFETDEENQYITRI
jgi:hypothetical protein